MNQEAEYFANQNVHRNHPLIQELEKECTDLRSQLTEARSQIEELTREKRAPVQGFSAGIPWSMHLRAYDAYCKKWGPQKALIELEGRNCRGGFSVSELDDFIPGWREELTEINQLKEECRELLAQSKHKSQLLEEADSRNLELVRIIDRMKQAAEFHDWADSPCARAVMEAYGQERL